MGQAAVFFDMDGTLWDEDMRVPGSAAEAVRSLRANGALAFLCSGRSLANIRSPHLLDIGFDGIVAACGAHIVVGGETRFEHLLSDEQVARAIAVTRRHGMSLVLEGPQYIYVDEGDFVDDPYVVYLRNELGSDLHPITGTSDFVVNKMSAAVNGADIDTVMREMGDDFYVIIHNPDLVEIGPTGFTKATGIAKTCELLGISHEDTYAFGDSANDLEMLEYVAHGVAMGNGSDEAKAAAGYVTTDIWDDGILNGLRHYGLAT